MDTTEQIDKTDPIDKKEPVVSPQAVTLYKARLDGIDFIKKQQWVVTNYAVLIYAAIVWVSQHAANRSQQLLWPLSGLVALVGLCAIGLLGRFQYDLGKAKQSLDRANAYCFTNPQRIALDVTNFEHPFGRDGRSSLHLLPFASLGRFSHWLLCGRTEIASHRLQAGHGTRRHRSN